MKLFLLATVMFVSVFAQARQYTQCSTYPGEGLYAVVNLTNREQGTLFLTPGVETDIRMLAKIVFKEQQGDNNVYEVLEAPFKGELHVPANIYGSKSDNVNVILFEGSIKHVFSCFSRHYED